MNTATSSYVTIPVNEFLALINANNPSATNPFVTVNDLLESVNIQIVATFSSLPAANTATGQFFFVEQSTGTKWWPTILGGNYRPAGLYYSNGTDWVTSPIPYQATQPQVDAGTDNETFVTPLTLNNYSKWNTKSTIGHTHTASEITDFDAAIENNTIVDSLITDSHTHSNKNILDQITENDYNILSYSISSGLITGGHITINDLDNTKFDISAGTGVIVDNTSYPPTKTFVSWPDLIAQSTPFLSTDANTFIAIDINGNPVLTSALQNYNDTAYVIILGWIEHTNNTFIERFLDEPYYIPDLQQQFQQFLEALKAFNISGNEVTANGNNLKLDISAGAIFDNGIGYSVDQHAVNIYPTNQISSVQIKYFYRNGSGAWVNDSSFVTDVNPNLYDNGSGTLQSVPIGNWIIQRVYYYGPFGYLDVYHSQATYLTKEEALNAMIIESFEENPYLSYDIPIAAIITQQGSTDLSNPATSEIRKLSKSSLGGFTNNIGESNIADNIGTAGVGIYKQKTGVTLEFKKLDSLSTVLSITDDITNNKINFNLSQASNLSNGYLSTTDWITFNNKQNALGFTPENVANKGVGNGYAPLDSSALLPAVNSRPSNVTYNATNGTLSFTWADGSSQNLDLPIENLLQNASYNSTTKELTLTLNGGGTIVIPLTDLVDLPEVVLSASSNPSVAPTAGQKLFLRQDNGAYWTNVSGVWTGGYLGVTSSEKTTWNGKQDPISFVAGANISISEGPTNTFTIEATGSGGSGMTFNESLRLITILNN